jgi:hypothetical protein
MAEIQRGRAFGEAEQMSLPCEFLCIKYGDKWEKKWGLPVILANLSHLGVEKYDKMGI